MVAAVLVVVSMAVLTWKGATAKEALASEVVADVPTWVKEANLPPRAVPGAILFATSGCTSCHTYLGSGSSNLGAPDLSEYGTKNLGIPFQIRHLQCPSCVNPGSPMPKFESLGLARLTSLAIFLESSTGTRGCHATRRSRACPSRSAPLRRSTTRTTGRRRTRPVRRR